jgi:hypothetical protein
MALKYRGSIAIDQGKIKKQKDFREYPIAKCQTFRGKLEICISGENGAVSKQTIHLLRPTDSAETTADRGSRLSCPRSLSPTRKRQQAGGGRENEQGE